MPEKFTIVKKGYSAEEVDKHIAQLEAQIKEHTQKEAAISGAMVSAEISAKQIINAATIKADEIVSDAKKEVAGILKMIDQEKKSLAEFCEVYDYIVNKYFTTNAKDMTAPLREKLDALSMTLEEHEKQSSEAHSVQDEPESPAEVGEQNEEEPANTVEGFF